MIAHKDLEQISSSEDDLGCLVELFEYLRAGKLSEAQSSLSESEHYEKYLWLIGSLPHFDNISFKDESTISSLIGCDEE
jgi:hypothetical protein